MPPRKPASLRSVFVRALEVVASASLLAGCCTGSHFELIIPTQDPVLPSMGDAAVADAATARTGPADCQTLCQRNGCSEVVACGPAEPRHGPDMIRCECVTLQCPAVRPPGGPVVGRRPEGFAARDAGASAGGLLAQMAEFEGASVPAFRRLRDELRTHGAPSELVEGAMRAMRDEARHYRAMSTLAARYGAAVKRPTVPRHDVRPLLEMARENAVEGCVHEAFSAALTLWQSQNARDAGVRAALAPIAEDEVEHAALALAVHAWASERLPAHEQNELRAAHQAAWDALLHELESSEATPPSWLREALMPSPRVACSLARALRDGLTSDEAASC